MSFVPATPVVGQEVIVSVTSSKPHVFVRLAGPYSPTYLDARPGGLGYVWRWRLTVGAPGPANYRFYVQETFWCATGAFDALPAPTLTPTNTFTPTVPVAASPTFTPTSTGTPTSTWTPIPTATPAETLTPIVILTPVPTEPTGIPWGPLLGGFLGGLAALIALAFAIFSGRVRRPGVPTEEYPYTPTTTTTGCGCAIQVEVEAGPPIGVKFHDKNQAQIGYAKPIRLVCEALDYDVIKIICSGSECTKTVEIYPRDALEYEWEITQESRRLEVGPDVGFWGRDYGFLMDYTVPTSEAYKARKKKAVGEQVLLYPPDLIRYDYKLESVDKAQRSDPAWLFSNAWNTDIWSYYSYTATIKLTVRNQEICKVKEEAPPVVVKLKLMPRSILQDREEAPSASFQQAYTYHGGRLPPTVYWAPEFQAEGEQELMTPTSKTTGVCDCAPGYRWEKESGIEGKKATIWDVCPEEEVVFYSAGADYDRLKATCKGRCYTGEDRVLPDPVDPEWSASKGSFPGGSRGEAVLFKASGVKEKDRSQIKLRLPDSKTQYPDNPLTVQGASDISCGERTMDKPVPAYWSGLYPEMVQHRWNNYTREHSRTPQAEAQRDYLARILQNFLRNRGYCFNNFIVLGELSKAVDRFWGEGNVKIREGESTDGYLRSNETIYLERSARQTGACILWHEMIHALFHASGVDLPANEHALVFFVDWICRILLGHLRSFEGELKKCGGGDTAVLRMYWDEVIRDLYFLTYELPYEKLAYNQLGEAWKLITGQFATAEVDKSWWSVLEQVAGFRINYEFLDRYRIGECGACCGGIRLFLILPPHPFPDL